MDPYLSSERFAKSQELLGAILQERDGKRFLRYPLGPLRKVIFLDPLSLDAALAMTSWRDAIVLVPDDGEDGPHEHAYIATLAADQAATKALLESRAKRALAQAEKAGIHLLTLTGKDIAPQAIDLFYGVYTDRMRRFRSPAVPKEYLEHQATEEGFFLLLALHGEECVGGATLIAYEGTLHNELVASSENALHLRVNNLLYWRFLTLAHDLRLKRVDYGPSPKGSSVAMFKESMGGRPVPTYRVHERYPRLLALARRLR